ncbi:Putative PAS domain-containing protein [Septoria linicola]|uniref:PAS domain-containing protein n=1 Tax=Septoria linicola TaxID=215465 RepID=A0A9Q9EHG6_9PEZI|nr:putative PAS domain-containing protein [Septoria linicola]USW50970.1 Putative PAS domain-containing protein [Septoria linicola]
MNGDSAQLDFGAVSFACALNADPRPTCVLDIHVKGGSAIVFQNRALQEKELLVDDILDSSASTGVQAWALEHNVRGTRSASSGHSLWLQTIDERWRVVQWHWQAPERKETNTKDHAPRIAPATKDASVTLREALADRDDATGKLQNILKMMEMVDVGIFEYDEKGVLQYGNNAFFKLSGHPRNSKRDTITWKESIFPEDEPWLFEQ